MIRAAALNHRDVWVLVDPQDYQSSLALMAQGGRYRELCERQFIRLES